MFDKPVRNTTTSHTSTFPNRTSQSDTHEDLSPVCDISNIAYETLAADRRGKSDHMARSHSAVDEANESTHQLEQQNNELMHRLRSTESKHSVSCAHENWAVTGGQLHNMRSKLSSELDCLRGELVPQINQLRTSAAIVANQITVVQVNSEDLQRRLSTTHSELEKWWLNKTTQPSLLRTFRSE
ncbi:hypothetical protein CSKR_112083 [Clonorchis sinensis]|uniref:Uncharacterized protein n=1 Tax=Clonorchis sinensis TaxID=79923 RepID=A0A3R7GS17_CLOSI|nr:hypothetical protein CSKR_112083 [Clonorchis sinensis]